MGTEITHRPLDSDNGVVWDPDDFEEGTKNSFIHQSGEEEHADSALTEEAQMNALRKILAKLGQRETLPGDPVVISGRDRGIIRTDPIALRGVLDQRLSDAGIRFGEGDAEAAIKQRVLDLFVWCGKTSFVTDFSNPRHPQELEDTSVSIVRINHSNVDESGSLVPLTSGDIDLKISFKGPLLLQPDSSVPSERTSITFSFLKTGAQRGVHLSFDENGEVLFTADTGRKIMNIPRADVTEYLLKHLPKIVHESDRAWRLSSGGRDLNPRDIASFVNRLGWDREKPESTKYINDKMDKIGYAGILYLPFDVFKDRHREGELFAITYPQNFIPSDYSPSSRAVYRIEDIAEELEIERELGTERSYDLQEAINEYMNRIAGNFSQVAIMTLSTSSIEPTIVKIETRLFDKACRYFLQNPEAIEAAAAIYLAITGKKIGQNQLSESERNAISMAIESGLWTDEPDSYDRFVKAIKSSLSEDDKTSDDRIHAAYNSLVVIGKQLRDHVCSLDDKAIMAKGRFKDRK